MVKFFLILLFISTLGFKINAEEIDEIETLYITDELRLSLYEEADQKSKVYQYLTSGEELTVVEKSGQYASVITEDGKKGWVKRGFLVSETPTVRLLEQEQEKNQRLIEELSHLANTAQIIDQYEKDMDVLSNQLHKMTKSKESTQTELNSIKIKKKDLMVKKSENKVYSIDDLITILQDYWHYLLSISFGLFLMGFLIAKKMLEARIKKKFQGIKVW